jgi:threonyl-tRNA synthetase
MMEPLSNFVLNFNLRRYIQCATVQLDFQLPIRFNLSYVTELNEPARPVIIHRAILGRALSLFPLLFNFCTFDKHLRLGSATQWLELS